MTPNQLFAILVEGLFAVVFVGALGSYVRRRDPVSRDVALTFSPFVGLLVLTLWRTPFGPPPGILSLIAGVLFFAQPIFALHLVSLIRPVPRRVLVGATVVLAGSLVPVVLVRPLEPLLALLPLAAFTGIQLLTAGYLAVAARGRRGPGGLRLAIAAAATVGLAVALLLTSGSALGPGSARSSPVWRSAWRCSPVWATSSPFVPPTVIRRVWQAGATVGYQGDAARPGGLVGRHDLGWLRQARHGDDRSGVRRPRASGSGRHRGHRRSRLRGCEPAVGAASAGNGPASPIRVDVVVETLAPEDPIRSVASAADARFVSVVDVGQEGSAARTLVVASPFRSLFHDPT